MNVNNVFSEEERELFYTGFERMMLKLLTVQTSFRRTDNMVSNFEISYWRSLLQEVKTDAKYLLTKLPDNTDNNTEEV